MNRLRYLMDNAVGVDFLPLAWQDIARAAPFLLDVVEAARAYLADDYAAMDLGKSFGVLNARKDTLRETLSALDSHLSAASERETPE